MRKNASMQDIADKLEISKNAVSLALNGKPGVSDETRNAVIKLARSLNYAGMGEGAANARNMLVMIPEYIRNDEYFYSKIYWSMERECRRHDYHMITCTINGEHEKGMLMPELAASIGWLGMVVVGIVSRDYLRFLQSFGKPIVLVDNYYDDVAIPGVVTANVEGSFQITSYLIGLGHREIGFIAPIHMTSSFYDRWIGFQKALDSAGIPLRREYCVFESSPLSSLLSSEDEIRNLVGGLGKGPTAWVCGNDRIAVGMLNVLHEAGKGTPREVSVVGFDDIELASLVIPSLTTVHVDRELMGSLAIERLIELCTTGGGLPVRSSIFTTVVERKSAAAPVLNPGS